MLRIAKQVAAALSVAAVIFTVNSPHANALAIPESGHRGATGVIGVVENSIYAVDYAALHGAYAIEGDVQWTKDGYRVMLHDLTLDRTTNCTGYVGNITFASLRKCADWKTVPQFSSWLKRAVERRLAVNPELKMVPTAAQAAQFTKDVKTLAPAFVVVASSKPAALTAIKATTMGTRAQYSAITTTTAQNYPQDPASIRKVGTVYMPHHTTLTVEKVAAFHQAGVKIWGWPAKTEADKARLIYLGVDVIVVDDVRQ